MPGAPQIDRSAKPELPGARRKFHLLAGSSLPVLGMFVSQELMVVFLAGLSGVALCLEVSRLTYSPLNRLLKIRLRFLLRENEVSKVTGATYMLIAALGCFIFFEPGVAIICLLFLSVGDPTASLVGSTMSGPRLAGKSLWGTLAFLIAASVLATIVWAVSIMDALWPLLVGAAIASLVELLPLPPDDNLTVPLVSGAAISAMITLT